MRIVPNTKIVPLWVFALLLITQIGYSQACACSIDEFETCINEPYVFIGYPRGEYSRRVSKLESLLESKGIHYWSYIISCPSPDLTQTADEIKENLEQIIQETAMVIILDPESCDARGSEFCRFEYDVSVQYFYEKTFQFGDIKKKIRRNKLLEKGLLAVVY